MGEGCLSDYLKHLRSAVRRAQRRQRRALIAEVTEHLNEGLAEIDASDPDAVGELLQQIGQPKSIYWEAVSAGVITPRARSDAWVPWLLYLGGPILYLYPLVRRCRAPLEDLNLENQGQALGTFVLPFGLYCGTLIVETVHGGQTTVTAQTRAACTRPSARRAASRSSMSRGWPLCTRSWWRFRRSRCVDSSGSCTNHGARLAAACRWRLGGRDETAPGMMLPWPAILRTSGSFWTTWQSRPRTGVPGGAVL